MRNLTIFVFILFISFVFSQEKPNVEVKSLFNIIQRQGKLIQEIESLLTGLEKNAEIEEKSNSNNDDLYNLLQNDIKTNGLKLGSHWWIKQEGDVLVFRDYVAKTDSRYAMFMNKYTDLTSA